MFKKILCFHLIAGLCLSFVACSNINLSLNNSTEESSEAATETISMEILTGNTSEPTNTPIDLEKEYNFTKESDKTYYCFVTNYDLFTQSEYKEIIQVMGKHDVLLERENAFIIGLSEENRVSFYEQIQEQINLLPTQFPFFDINVENGVIIMKKSEDKNGSLSDLMEAVFLLQMYYVFNENYDWVIIVHNEDDDYVKLLFNSNEMQLYVENKTVFSTTMLSGK